MDFFGIGSAMRGIARVYFGSARATGRTTSLVQTVKEGDRVIFRSTEELREFKRLLLEARKQGVELVIVDPKMPGQALTRGRAVGRTFFDHTWIEDFYFNYLEQAERDIHSLEQNTSMNFERRETQRTRIEISKWPLV